MLRVSSKMEWSVTRQVDNVAEQTKICDAINNDNYNCHRAQSDTICTPNLSDIVQIISEKTDWYLEIHESHQLLHLRTQHFHCLLIDLNSVRLLVRLYLRTQPHHTVTIDQCSCATSSSISAQK